MSTTTARGGARPTPPPTRPATPGPVPVHAVLARELAAAFVLLAVVLVTMPARPGTPDAPGGPWEYQRETVAVAGGGPLNAYARAAIRATAWLARASIERQRDVGRLNLLHHLAGEPAAAALSGWRQAHQLALRGGTAAALLALVTYGVLLRPASRAWAVAILLLLGLTLLVTKPGTVAGLAGGPGIAVPAAATQAVTRLDPGGDPGQAGGADAARQALATRYWRSFVGSPLSRLQTGSRMLADAPPARKPGALAAVRRHLPGVDAWATGRHALGRAVIATVAVVYVLPFALALGALAMVAACAQALSLLLGVGGLVAVPLALDPRRRAAVARWWLAPLAGSVLLLGVASLLSASVMWAGAALHATDEAVGAVLAGSTWPVAGAALLVWRLRRRQAEGLPASPVAGGRS
jgi:hypothetical protein